MCDLNTFGYLAIRRLDDGRLLCVVPLFFGRARITEGYDLFTYGRSW
jgi:hypothetical protein